MQALRFAVCTAIFVCLATLLPFASGAAALELAPVMPASPPRTATVLRVPDDYTTIQAAIDAAQPGDEIRTVLGALPNPDDPPDYFAESLAISKTLTLSGGWNTSFTAVEGYSYLIPPAGRGMTIEPDDPITVTIRGFYVTGGDATGLGCGTISAGSRPGDFSADALGMDSSLRVATLLTPSVQGMGSAQTTDLNDWMATLDGLDAAGLYPGSTAALKRVRARIDQMAGAEAIGLNAAQVQAPAGPAADALDCGGGVFSDGANLIIENSVFAKNVASKANSGYGGGMCVANGNLQIESSEFTLNTASTTQGGEGGGLQVSSIPTGGVVTLRDLTVYRNTGAAGCAQGGGVSIVDYSQDNIVATVSIETSEFRENVTSLTCNSDTGAASGGGLRVQHIPGVRIVGNQFLANMVGAQTIETMGGGLLLGRSPDAVVSGNTFKDNVASGLTTYQNNGATPWSRISNPYPNGLQFPPGNTLGLLTSNGLQATLGYHYDSVQGERLDTGAKANSTTYHVYLIRRPDTGVVDVLFSTSASAPTMPTNYSQKRRIGSIMTDGSGTIRPFVQYGDRFDWVTTVLDVNNALNPGTSAVTRGCTVPQGISVTADLIFQVDNSGNAGVAFGWLSALDCADEAPASGAAMTTSAASATGRVINAVANAQTRTNTSGQVRTRLSYSDASVAIYLRTRGWIDHTRRFL